MTPAYVNAELAQVGAVLVDERIVRRVIDAHLQLYRVGLQVPHGRCYSIPRSALERYVAPEEIGGGISALPEDVALVTGDRAALASLAPAAWSNVWRTIFHARIHQTFEVKRRRGELTLATVRHRIEQIGTIEFDEVRAVLRHDEQVLPPADDIALYIELAALYLELRHFAPALLEPTFPALRDSDRIEATLALDVDGAQLLAACRPASAPPQPIVETAPAQTPVPREAVTAAPDPKAGKRAASARRRGDRARAAILSVRAGEIDAARADLDQLVGRLGQALGLEPPPTWSPALLTVVLQAASQRLGRFDVGARLLDDLQAACVVAEREAMAVDVLSWVRTRGALPLVRPLPATREVRVARHVRSAVAKLARAQLGSSADWSALTAALHEMADAAEANIRAVVRPKIERVLRAVGFEPNNVAEQVSEKRLVDELLDRAVAIGRLSLGDLRDAISRNDLRMHDLRLGELYRGDPLLRCDRILSVSLDGVHRRGEAYLRALQKVSSVLFGTPLGRLLTRFVLLPVLGAFAILEGLQHLIAPISTRLFALEPELATPSAFAIGAAVLFVLLYVPFSRRVVSFGLNIAWGVARVPLVVLPRALWRHPGVRRMVTSPVMRWGIRPAIPAALLAALLHGRARWPIAIAVFCALVVITNLRSFRILEERAADYLLRSTRQLATMIVPGLVKSTLAGFAWLLDLFDRGMYRVDRWLRFRSGQARVMIVVKGVLGTLWSIVAYFLRLYINLFLEPTVNPIKHFPVVTVAAKIMLPFTPVILGLVARPSVSLLGPTLGNSFAVLSVFLLPGLAGFLVWELKENWKLYRSTRYPTVRPIAIGQHGETMVALFVPGFHSGTIPKHLAKLRRAAWRGEDEAIAKHHHAVEDVESEIETFVDRQLVSLLNQAPGLDADDLSSTCRVLGSNRVEVALVYTSVGPDPIVIRIEQEAGWLLGCLHRRGWLDRLDDPHRRVFETALCGFYKMAGVGLVREQLVAALGGDGAAAPAYYVAGDMLHVSPRDRLDVEITYNLRSRRLKPKLHGVAYTGSMPRLTGQAAVFDREPLRWTAWVEAWQRIALGETPPAVVHGPSLL